MQGISKKILVVEDEALIAWDISDMLEAEGLEVVGPATSLSEGLKTAASHQIDAALLDINLGAETVWPLAEWLDASGVPFVFITADLHHPELGTRFASKPRLGKPAHRDQILHTLNTELARESQSRAA